MFRLFLPFGTEHEYSCGARGPEDAAARNGFGRGINNMWEVSLSLLYRLGTDLFGVLSKRKHRPSPSEVARQREKWKPVFEERIWRRRKAGLSQDVIIRDVRRIDRYPNPDASRGISPWFKVGLLGTYHRGIHVVLGWEGSGMTSRRGSGCLPSAG